MPGWVDSSPRCLLSEVDSSFRDSGGVSKVEPLAIDCDDGD